MPSLVENGQVVLHGEEDFQSCQCIFTKSQLPTLEKMTAHHLKNPSIPFTQGCFNCAKFGWIWPCTSREEDENVKSLQQQSMTTNIRKANLIEPLAQVS